MISCPFCEGQGVIYKAKVIKNNIPIFICDECDTMWLIRHIRGNNCINFKEFMNNLGVKPLWSELYDVIQL